MPTSFEDSSRVGKCARAWSSRRLTALLCLVVVIPGCPGTGGDSVPTTGSGEMAENSGTPGDGAAPQGSDSDGFADGAGSGSDGEVGGDESDGAVGGDESDGDESGSDESDGAVGDPSGESIPVIWSASEGVVWRNGVPVELRGVNWFGMETADHAPHGLWSGRTVDELVATVASMGFNAMRLPLGPASVREGFATADWAQAAGLATGRDALEAVLTAATAHDVWVLLDYHSCDDAHGDEQAPQPGACEGETLETWHDDLRALATLALEHPGVLGIDLFNEPYGLTWTQWSVQASTAAEAVLEVHPDVLVFVGGVGNASASAGYSALWGGNLTEAATEPPTFRSDRMVFAPHAYGPSVSPMPYFDVPSYPTNLPAIWDAHFGHLALAGATVVLGEWGSKGDDDAVPGSVAWQTAWLEYVATRPFAGYFYWALNANTGQVAGLLEDDWTTPNATALDALAPLLP